MGVASSIQSLHLSGPTAQISSSSQQNRVLLSPCISPKNDQNVISDPNLIPDSSIHYGRNCIGKGLSLLQVKIGIAQMVHKFKIAATPRTPAKFELDPRPWGSR